MSVAKLTYVKRNKSRNNENVCMKEEYVLVYFNMFASFLSMVKPVLLTIYTFFTRMQFHPGINSSLSKRQG